VSTVEPLPDDRDLRYRGPQEPEVRPARRTDRKAIAALVFGVLGLLVLPIVFSVLAVVLGALSVRATRRDRALGGRGLAIAGIVLGIVGLLVGLVLVGTALIG
jgi:hypothetical protein